MFYRESDIEFDRRLAMSNLMDLQILEFAYLNVVARLFTPYHEESYYRDRYELHDTCVRRLNSIRLERQSFQRGSDE